VIAYRSCQGLERARNRTAVPDLSNLAKRASIINLNLGSALHSGLAPLSFAMDLFLSTLLSFLPKRYREMFTPDELPAAAGIWSGLLEALTSAGLLVRGYYAYMSWRMANLPAEVFTKAGEKGGESAIMGMGSIFMLEYLILPTTILLAFFMFEGFVRAIAATGADEVLPSVPLQILAFLHGHLSARNDERRLGTRIRDEVQPVAAGSLLIASCRPKPWTQLTTISHEGVLYELINESEGLAPRRFVYTLRRKPLTAVIRGIHDYNPDELLSEN
jgi:hypothetical protein